jgi:hypothetical protein
MDAFILRALQGGKENVSIPLANGCGSKQE